MSLEDQFWKRILELAQNRIKTSTYVYFVTSAKLIQVEDGKALIYLDGQAKELFWKTNLEDIILTAGFEVYDQEIKVTYTFEKNERESQVEVKPLSIKEVSSSSYQAQPISTENTGLKAKYTFDNFVQGKGNIMAKAAALAVADAERLGGMYNPLFIHGGPGLGKTHLLNAIGNDILGQNPYLKVKYISSESFINDFLEHIRLNNMENFKKRYRNLDVLLIDDIQVLSKKVSTQEEFFHTFNALHSENKLIVLTSDRSPQHLEGMEERLVSRFDWGLTSDITPPDFETRIAILRNKIQEFDFEFLNETIEYLAGQFDSNVRELEGALKDISLLANVRQIKVITIDLAAEAIRARKQDSTKLTIIPIEQIQSEVGNFYGVSVKEMKGTRRVQNIVLARQVAMYLSRELTDNSLPKIGKEFGGKDHTTVMHAITKIKSMIETDDNIRLEIDSIKNKIR